LVSYFLSPFADTNDWDIGAKLIAPDGTMTTLTSVNSCAGGTCSLNGFYSHIANAYNKLEDSFIVVWVQFDPAYGKRLLAQMYNGTSGALLGSTIDLTSVLPAALPASPFIGVASHPNATVNPNHEFVLVVDNLRVHILPNGTFTSAPLSPAGTGIPNWTFQWTTSTSDTHKYQRLWDFEKTSPIAVQRFTSSIGGTGADYAVDGAVTAWAERLAFGPSNNTMAIWTGAKPHPATMVVEPFVRFRLIDRN